MRGTRRVFEFDQRRIVKGAPVNPNMSITHQRLDDIQTIGLTKHSHDFATIPIGVEHIHEHLTVADDANQRGARGLAVRLIFLRRIDILQTNIDLAALRRPNEETIAIEDSANLAGEITIGGNDRRRPKHTRPERAGAGQQQR
jgi:hypothetical protein